MVEDILKNNFEELANELFDHIKANKDFFNTPEIVVPNRNIEAWLKSYWLHNEKGVLANVKFTKLDEFCFKLFDIWGFKELLHDGNLEIILIKVLSDSSNRKLLPKNIQNYIYDAEKINAVKLYDISKELTRVFSNYEKKCFLPTGWEKEIFDLCEIEFKKCGYVTFNQMLRDEYKFKSDLKDVYIFGFTHLDKNIEEVLNKAPENFKIKKFSIRKTSNAKINFDVTAAPSIIREVENLHSSICEILKNKGNSFKDFVVYVPNLEKYIPTISRVFEQDDVSFPRIPYVFSGSTNVISDVNTIIRILFGIKTKGFYSRSDFADLVRNETVKKNRKLSDDDIDKILDVIVKLNVFRTSSNRDDFGKLLKRLLVSKIAPTDLDLSHTLKLSEGEFLAYSNISLNDELLVKFVCLIKDLESFREDFSKDLTINVDNITLLENHIMKWISSDEESILATKSAKNVAKTLYFYKFLALENTNLSLDILFYSLIDNSNLNNNKTGDLFLNGISFLSIKENNYIFAKNTFVLGLSQDNFPKKVTKSELDYSDDDDFDYEKEFFDLITSNDSDLHISYVNADLTKDAEKYISPFITDRLISNNIKIEDFQKNIFLDEKREWKELFTKKEFKNKGYFNYLGKENEEIKNIEINHSFGQFNVKLKVIRDYLKEPLKLKATNIFGTSNDDNEEKINTEFEPFGFDKLIEWSFKKRILEIMLGNKLSDFTKDLFNETYEEYKMLNKFSLVSEENEASKYFAIKEEIEDYVNLINEITNGEYNILGASEIEILDFINGENIKYRIDNPDKFIQYEKDKNIKFFDFKIKTESKCKESDFLNLYVLSLFEIAKKKDNIDYNVEIILNRKNSKTYVLNSEYSLNILKNVLFKMTNNSDLKAMPINYAYDFIKNPDKERSYEGLNTALKSIHGDWSFYSDKDIFSEEDYGYEINNFEYEFNRKLDEIKEFIVYIKDETEEF